jgi:hypothetical protein
MATHIVFYKQVRQDGGVRTGVEVGDTSVLHHFKEGSHEFDPALLWWADVRCDGRKLPDEPEEVRQWLLDNAESICAGFLELANKLQAGMDVDIYPLQHEVREAPSGVRMSVFCSAVRRLTARNMAQELQKLARNWKRILDQLDSAVPQA